MHSSDEPQPRSPFWLSPGIDVPTHDKVRPGMRSSKSLVYISDDTGDAAFVPTPAFMRQSPTWRLDVLGDLLEGIRRVQQHAAVELFRELSQHGPQDSLDKQPQNFRATSEILGLELPDNVEALIVLDRQFTSG